MNRREFVKAQARIPLLGLLAKLPKAEGKLKFAGYPDLGSYVSDVDAWHTLICDAESGFIELGCQELGPYIVFDKTGLRFYDSGGMEVEWIRADL